MKSAVLVCGLCVGFLGGCGGSDDTGGSGSTGTTADAATSAGAGGAGSSGSATGGGAPACVYPAGPFGLGKGSTIDGALQFNVLAPAKSFGTELAMGDLQDCDAARGINAIFVKISASWCGPCKEMAHEIEQLYQTTWQGKGILVEELLVENLQGAPAGIADAVQWRAAIDATTPVYTGVDPGNTFHTDFFPFTTLIDPRTMQVVAQDSDTYFIDLADVLALAEQNM